MNPLLAVGDSVWLAGIATAGSIVTAIVAAIGAYQLAKLNTKQDEAAVKVRQVADKLDTSTNRQDEKLDDIHGLINSEKTEAVRRAVIDKELILVLTRRVGDHTAIGIAEAALKELQGQLRAREAAQLTLDATIAQAKRTEPVRTGE